MGKLFVHHLASQGARIYQCRCCRADLAKKEDLVFMEYLGKRGDGYLFKRAFNIYIGLKETKLIGSTFYSGFDVFCKPCGTKIGWLYCLSDDLSTKFKEDKVCLESSKVKLKKLKDQPRDKDDRASIRNLYSRYANRIVSSTFDERHELRFGMPAMPREWPFG